MENKTRLENESLLKAAYKKAISENLDFAAHVLMLHFDTGCDADKACMMAWMEGPEGFAIRKKYSPITE
jgi:hypothetical protein